MATRETCVGIDLRWRSLRPVKPRQTHGLYYDVFISSASEDSDAVARPLARELSALGMTVWFDEFVSDWGDSVARQINEGLRGARVGVVILSPSFMTKKWLLGELDSLMARHLTGDAVLVPVWHDVSAADVRSFSPLLADRVAVSSNIGVKAVASAIAEVVTKRQFEPATATTVPPYLGRVSTLDGEPLGTCFQLDNGVFATSFHVAQGASPTSQGRLLIQCCQGTGPPIEARPERVSRKIDLAVLRSSGAFRESVASFVRSDDSAVDAPVVVTSAAMDRTGMAYSSVEGLWRGVVTGSGSVPVGRIEGITIVPGMSGAPVIRVSDGAVVGMVAGSQPALGNEFASSILIARTEDVADLLRGILQPHFVESRTSTDNDGVRLFYSYSHRDERYRAQLETHLALLRRQGTIREWHDRKIGAGDEWRRAISGELSRAEVILLLVSPDFMGLRG